MNRTVDLSKIPVSDGSGQRERMPTAFRPGHFEVDEMSFETLLAMGAEFAARMKYYNLANRADGDWGELFHADEAVVMADMLSVDLKRLESEFRAISYLQPVAVADFLLRLARRFERWYRRLSAAGGETGELMAGKLETLILDKLAPELRRLLRIVAAAGIEPGIDTAEFGDIWRHGISTGEDPAQAPADAPQPRAQDIKHSLSASFYVFANAVAHLQQAGRENLQQSLHSQRHEPAVGLLMVFLRLYAKAQNRLNRFTARHLDFYYRQVLAAANRPRTADSYYLLLTARPGAGKLWIDSNTAFSAGQDADLNEIVYRADENLLLHDVRVESLLTLNLQHDRLILPESNFGFVTRIKADRPHQDGAEAETDGEPAEHSAWPLFGAGAAAADAGIGFCIASPLLLLRQGRRRIEISIVLEPPSSTDPATPFEHLLKSASPEEFRRRLGTWFALYLLRFGGGISDEDKTGLLDRAGALLPAEQCEQVGRLINEDWQGLFYRLFKKPFCLHLSTETGWFEIEDIGLLPLDENRSAPGTGFRLLLDLAAAAPPVSGYRPEQHGGQLDTDFPVLKCELNQQAHFCIYSVLRDLRVDRLDIEVAVEGVTQLQVYNQNGQLDAARPFQPFGPIPNASSYLAFGNFEMAQKQLQQLSLHLEWTELPAAAGGFGEHYSAYASGYDNESFEVDFSALNDRRWVPADPANRDRFKLFATRARDQAVAAQQEIKIEGMNFARPVEAGVAESDFKYDLNASGGFYRLSLVNPPGGFGHDEYTRLLTSVLAANARKKKPEPIPNPPYTPMLDRVKLDYRAKSSLDPALDRDRRTRLFHLHPFGVESVYPAAAQQTCHLLPQYRQQGNLFIGLGGDDVAGPLTLLFHLAQDRVEPYLAGQARFEWSYLTDDGWRPLPQKNLLADNTCGFLASGRVTLDIPADIGTGSRIMPGNCYWLHLAVDRAADAFSACYFVKPHAIKVSRDMAAGGREDSAMAGPRQNDWSLLRRIAGVGSVSQAYAAFGGRPAETGDGFKIRISERLRHKNRAVTPRDYEQLALERFPELEKVKCFSSLSWAREAVMPGQVLIAVVPRVDMTENGACRRLRVDARKLSQIRDFLLGQSPPFIRLEVINPVYERIQVRCKVKFADELSEGVNLKRLDQQISDYLCPWKKPGYCARFGWKIRQRDLEAHILSLGYIDYVTDFSMLHITVDRDDRYKLIDTASSNSKRKAVIEPRYPWSLAIPMRHHFLETTRDIKPVDAQLTGVGELEIGATFIIGSGEHGEEE